MSTIIEKPKVQIDPEILQQLATQSEEAGQVILHFLFRSNPFTHSKIRIWPTSFLYDLNSSHRSEMVHFENISLYPEWMDVAAGGMRFFTLFFSGLPRDCTHFDFVEECGGEAYNFEVRKIPRNKQDVYYIQMY